MSQPGFTEDSSAFPSRAVLIEKKFVELRTDEDARAWGGLRFEAHHAVDGETVIPPRKPLLDMVLSWIRRA